MSRAGTLLKYRVGAKARVIELASNLRGHATRHCHHLFDSLAISATLKRIKAQQLSACGVKRQFTIEDAKSN